MTGQLQSRAPKSSLTAAFADMEEEILWRATGRRNWQLFGRRFSFINYCNSGIDIMKCSQDNLDNMRRRRCLQLRTRNLPPAWLGCWDLCLPSSDQTEEYRRKLLWGHREPLSHGSRQSILEGPQRLPYAATEKLDPLSQKTCRCHLGSLSLVKKSRVSTFYCNIVQDPCI